MGILIGTAEVTWHYIKKFWASLPEVKQVLPRSIMRIAQAIANVTMRDPRNAPYLPFMIFLCFWAPALFLWALYRHQKYGFEIWMFFAYNFLRIGPRFRFFAHQHVLLHKEGHDYRGFFKGPFSVFNFWVCQWFLGPFYGQVPNSYACAHNKIHHRYDNGLDDVHTTLDLDRRSPWTFVAYLPRFMAYWSGLSCVWFFFCKGKADAYHGNRMLWGMVYYYGMMAIFAMYDWRFALSYYVYPHFESMVFFGLISYMWHIFVDPKDPNNQYVNSLTILDGHDNIWNEDFHVVHHVAPHVHWTDYKAHYERNVEEYRKNQATIFRDTEEGIIGFWLLTQNWDELATHFVDLNGKMTHEQKKALLLERLAFRATPKQ